ncbi:MAG TPA: HAMP domain-containing sensor histidine kinase, partial [Aggregatilineales bacterium]|nr:HAMP domain-containing sensor histidine kinase [Aggregatilineales bacterium]
SVSVKTACVDGRVSAEISDTGMGISPEDLPHIFERFYRTRSAHATRREGTGLGLSIADKIIHLHGGTIEVDSKPDEGSTFRVWLPTA